MSQIYISGLVIILVQLNNLFGLHFGNDELTNAATVLVTLALGGWIMIRRKQQGDINALGGRR